MLQLLEMGIPLLVLRSDVSGLGALAAGALSAAVGTSTALRHLYPQSDGGGGPPVPQPAALVKQCLAYVRLFRIAFAQQAHPDSAMWRCPCTVCNGRELAWLAQRPPEEQQRLAFEHSLETLLDIRDELLAPGLTTLERAPEVV